MKYKLVRKTVFTVRVVYKSGYYHDFDVYKLTVKGKTYQWESVDDRNKPIDIATRGADDIESVWQIGVRKKWVIEK
jgi:hypothetical protein